MKSGNVNSTRSIGPMPCLYNICSWICYHLNAIWKKWYILWQVLRNDRSINLNNSCIYKKTIENNFRHSFRKLMAQLRWIVEKKHVQNAINDYHFASFQKLKSAVFYQNCDDILWISSFLQSSFFSGRKSWKQTQNLSTQLFCPEKTAIIKL